MAKILKIKIIVQEDGIQSLENNVNAFLLQEKIVTEDFIDIKYNSGIATVPPGHQEHNYILIIYRKEAQI